MNACRKPGLYVHFPFCRSKCPYCAFFSIPSSTLIPRWIDGIERESATYEGRFGRFDSLYLGGGTPTLMDIETLSSLMDHLFSHFAFTPDPEMTIEANPNDLSKDKLHALKGLGFNRISIGIQSFDDRILTFLGRRHTAKEAEEALTIVRSSGFKNIGLDLMYGFEEQPLKEWIGTLKRAVHFQPEHISCYQLTFEDKTPFGRLRHRGLIRPLNENEERSFFLATSQFLRDKGYSHYEISSFSRDRAGYSLHNSKYWDHTPYLGLGPSAHSFDGSRRWWNVQSVRRYCEALEGERTPLSGCERLTDEQLRLESIALGLRTRKGFDLTNIHHNSESNDMVLRLRDSGFLRVTSGRVIPTTKGFLVADSLPICLSSTKA